VAKDCDAVWKAFLARVYIRGFPEAADMLEGRAQVKSKTAQQQTRRRSGDDPTDDELMNIFRAEYILISGDPFKVWHAYNYDTHNFDMQRKSICVAVRTAWYKAATLTKAVEGPPYCVLRLAMKEKREHGLETCDQNTTLDIWRIGLSTGAHYTKGVGNDDSRAVPVMAREGGYFLPNYLRQGEYPGSEDLTTGYRNQSTSDVKASEATAACGSGEFSTLDAR
jgi:hypothetical protein